MMSGDKQALIELLKLYKEYPCLWNQAHSLYLNKEARKQAYDKLLEVYKCYQQDGNVQLMKKKIENMRFIYKREYKKVMAAKKKGLDYRPTLWYYDLFSFLHNDADYDDNKLEFTEEEYIDESLDDKYEEYEAAQIKPKKRFKITEVFVQNQNTSDNTSLKSTRDSIADRVNEDESLAFGRTVGLQLSELDNDQRIIAEKLISDTIFLARLGKLTTNSTIEHE